MDNIIPLWRWVISNMVSELKVYGSNRYNPTCRFFFFSLNNYQNSLMGFLFLFCFALKAGLSATLPLVVVYYIPSAIYKYQNLFAPINNLKSSLFKPKAVTKNMFFLVQNSF